MNEFKEKLTELLSQIKEEAHTVTEMIKEKGKDGADWVKTHKKIALPIAAILLCLCLAGGGVLIAGSVMDNQPSGKITAEKEKDADTEETLSADVSEADTLDGTDEDGDITEDPASEEADADADTAADDAAAVSKSDQSSDQKTSDKTSKSTASTSKSSSKNTSSNQTSKPSGSKGNASSSKPSGSNSGSANVNKPSSSGSTSSSKPSNSGSASKPSSGSTSAPSTPSKPAHTHSYVSTVTTQPTCCNPGVRTYTCSCGSSYTESIPATGNHNWVAQTMKQPVCEWRVICNGCGKDFGSSPAAADAAVNHLTSSDFYGPCQSYTSKYVQIGTTTITTGYKCSVCGATK